MTAVLTRIRCWKRSTRRLGDRHSPRSAKRLGARANGDPQYDLHAGCRTVSGSACTPPTSTTVHREPAHVAGRIQEPADRRPCGMTAGSGTSTGSMDKDPYDAVITW